MTSIVSYEDFNGTCSNYFIYLKLQFIFSKYNVYNKCIYDIFYFKIELKAKSLLVGVFLFVCRWFVVL